MKPVSLRDPRVAVMPLAGLAAVVALVLYGPIHQPEWYHQFADQRTVLGVPRFADTVSNVPFLLVGIAGVAAFWRGVPRGALASLRAAYLVLFGATALLLPGSGYYHLWPSNATLTWDRLPMALAFMALAAIILGEHLDEALGRRMLVPLLCLGVASVGWWRLTDNGDGGDLRPYILVQVLPMVLVPYLVVAFPARLRPTRYLWGLLAAYALAKVLELLDRPVYEFVGVVSGHSLKHLAAAAGIGVFLAGLHARRLKENS